MYSKALVNSCLLCYVGRLVTLTCLAMLCRPFGDLSHVWLCYEGPLLTLACLAMLCRPFGDLSRVWLCYVGPVVTLGMFDYVM